MKTNLHITWFLSCIILAGFSMSAYAQTPVPADGQPAIAPATAGALQPSAFQMFIPLISTALVALLKTFFPKIPRAILPILCPILGAAVDIVGHYTGLGGGNGLTGAILGGVGVCLREAYDQGKKALAATGTT